MQEIQKGEISVNAYKGMKKRIPALVLCAAMAAAPVCALALETAPLVPGAQNAQQQEEKMQAFDRNRGYHGHTASSRSMLQVRVDGIMLNMRVHTLQGAEITFHENLAPASTRGEDIRLELMASGVKEDVMLQFDQEALDVLARMNVTEVAVAGRDRSMVGVYTIAELNAVRAALGLKPGEKLCISGKDDPVTVVSEDGVRRMVTQ